MKNIKVSLRPLVNNLNLPTVIKTAILPGDTMERLFIATQVGEIFYVGDGYIETFLDISSQILRLGESTNGYDERGLLGLAFHPAFYYNGLFYLHYSVAGSQGPGALQGPFKPNPCDPTTLNMKWTNREVQFDHIDTVEEWMLQANGQPQKRRTLLNLRRPFLNHNGINSLNFSPETGSLVLTTGDGGSGYDPFNLGQDDMEIAGKILEIDVNNTYYEDNPPVVTRFHELPASAQEMLTVIAKGVRNIPGISYQKLYNQYIKYVGIVGQDLVEAIYSFLYYKPIPVTEIVQAARMKLGLDLDGFINFGWRGWEGDLPTTILTDCPSNKAIIEKKTAYYDDLLMTSVQRLQPLTCYYHQDSRPDKFGGMALTGVHPYVGDEIPELTNHIVFSDLAQEDSPPPARGTLAYTEVRKDCNLNDYGLLEIDYDFGSQSSYYVSLGANLDQTRLYLGVYGSENVGDMNLGTVYEIIP